MNAKFQAGLREVVGVTEDTIDEVLQQKLDIMEPDTKTERDVATLKHLKKTKEELQKIFGATHMPCIYEVDDNGKLQPKPSRFMTTTQKDAYLGLCTHMYTLSIDYTHIT